jgi:hypothetical protein
MLEKFIRENKTAFNSEEPNEGHEFRFQKRLVTNAQNSRRLIHPVLEYVAVAAVVIFIAITILFTKDAEPTSKSMLSLDITSNEFTEARYYYQVEINNHYNKLVEDCQSDNNDLIADVEYDFASLDEDYEQLLVEFNDNPGDDRVKSAIIQVYQQKLEILSLVIEKTCEIK